MVLKGYISEFFGTSAHSGDCQTRKLSRASTPFCPPLFLHLKFQFRNFAPAPPSRVPIQSRRDPRRLRGIALLLCHVGLPLRLFGAQPLLFPLLLLLFLPFPLLLFLLPPPPHLISIFLLITPLYQLLSRPGSLLYMSPISSPTTVGWITCRD